MVSGAGKNTSLRLYGPIKLLWMAIIAVVDVALLTANGIKPASAFVAGACCCEAVKSARSTGRRQPQVERGLSLTGLTLPLPLHRLGRIYEAVERRMAVSLATIVVYPLLIHLHSYQRDLREYMTGQMQQSSSKA